MAIRYDKKLNNEIKRIVRNYNAKINRLEHSIKNYQLPEKIYKEDIKKIKTKFNNRTDLRRYLKDIQEFNQRGAENLNPNYKVPNYIYNITKRRQRQLKYHITRDLKLYNKNVTIGGREQLSKLKEIEREQYQNLLAKKEKLLDIDLSSLSLQEFIELNRSLQANTKIKSSNQFKKNFEIMFQNITSLYNLDNKKSKEIINKLDSLSSSQLSNLLISERLLNQFIYYYGNLKEGDVYETTDEIKDIFDELYNNIDEIV